jgi:hypothetical protein
MLLIILIHVNVILLENKTEIKSLFPRSEYSDHTTTPGHANNARINICFYYLINMSQADIIPKRQINCFTTGSERMQTKSIKKYCSRRGTLKA